MKEKRQHIFIDFEFTMPEKNIRMKNFYPEIIEVGIVSVINDQVTDQYSSFVKPARFPKLSDRCRSFLHITQDQVDKGLSFPDLVFKLEHFNKSYENIVITWGNMDMKVLRHNCLQAKMPFPFQKAAEIDLSMEYKRFFGDQNQTGLWKAVQEYGKEGTGRHHRALDDALTTFNIFRLVEKDKRYLQRPEPTTIGDRIDFSKLLNELA